MSNKNIFSDLYWQGSSYSIYSIQEFSNGLENKESQNTMLPSKYVRYPEAKEFVSKQNFKTLADYRKFVIQHHIANLPLDPSATYAYKGFVPYEFLGLDKATYKANIKEARTVRFATRKVSRPKKVSKNIQVLKSITGLDPDKVIQFLITEDVAPETIVKLVAEMNINSGTLMAELCKYMTKKTAEKQATWRPTGYNIAEAQMSLKM